MDRGNSIYLSHVPAGHLGQLWGLALALVQGLSSQMLHSDQAEGKAAPRACSSHGGHETTSRGAETWSISHDLCPWPICKDCNNQARHVAIVNVNEQGRVFYFKGTEEIVYSIVQSDMGGGGFEGLRPVTF